MTDPLRKPRKLRFRVTRTLLISAPLIGGLACGEPQMTVNPIGPESPPPEERVNVPAVERTPPPTMEERIGQPVEATNVVEEETEPPAMQEPATPMEEPPAMVRERPRMVNPGPRPRPTVNPAPDGLDDL